MPNTVPAESSVFRVLSFVSTRKWPSRRLLEWRLLEFNWGCDWTQNFESLLNYFTQILCVLSDFMNLFISHEKVLNTNVVQKDFFLLHSNVLRGPLAAACNLEPQVGRSWFKDSSMALPPNLSPGFLSTFQSCFFMFKEFHKRRVRMLKSICKTYFNKCKFI